MYKLHSKRSPTQREKGLVRGYSHLETTIFYDYKKFTLKVKICQNGLSAVSSAMNLATYL